MRPSRASGRLVEDAPGWRPDASPSSVPWLARPLQAGTALFPTVHPAPRPCPPPVPRSAALEVARTLGERHEDVARDLGWPPGEWCE